MNLSELKSRLSALQLCVSVDKTRPVLMGILVDAITSNEDFYILRLVATDGELLLVQNLNAHKAVWESCGMPVSSLIQGNVLLPLGGGGVGFLIMKDAEYPNWPKVVPSEYPSDNEGLPFFTMSLISRIYKISSKWSKKSALEKKPARPLFWAGAERATIWYAPNGYLLAMPCRINREQRDTVYGFDLTGEAEYEVSYTNKKEGE